MGMNIRHYHHKDYCIEEAMWLTYIGKQPSWDSNILLHWTVQPDGSIACGGNLPQFCTWDDYDVKLEVLYKGDAATLDGDCLLGDAVQLSLLGDTAVEEFVVIGRGEKLHVQSF